ncbi:MAG: hypothetical protein A2487_06475 [Candidatus Raymondbacteria bacterium RifOxyC12_full_50_8]|uniref:Uncharacterized protein n=1 Tax=Candidatus Raymondbacteria bacterium RIFOXYD12_FULL_49_13 TaxID=1817890 RepID=A0A1F7FHU6_UNCRA|nr:MAG: hypothetical protein A2248_21190 [Candidatus Raymondbacteria bacterium RIFOXYA2_FULL_49_16]OGJ95691.1 MAG: hypothetical protein A2350_12180 [Candidatus Raymondbacteria bacterium RifOxyB12_full_50_8]OGK05946.1 MAG: hypothetical protein A2487_06475 [Candidatus Raymondbacteria bacterium RifOxyC12_full_50_8]OGK06304.1 MAG: hypothetical protein A2519_08505 [Candidatus Raymondbacteria bacterium RIFOXYD12_FULL_49_13]OGP40637.1 MAG: hypothetical protein A2324_03260 [Candidatus Raymondbacteria b
MACVKLADNAFERAIGCVRAFGDNNGFLSGFSAAYFRPICSCHISSGRTLPSVPSQDVAGVILKKTLSMNYYNLAFSKSMFYFTRYEKRI